MLYNEYRPRTFDEVCGQEQNTSILRRQVANKKTGHAYLFQGHHGCGKTTVARILMMAVNCENPQDGNPCLCCDSCKAFLNNQQVDCIEMDAASNNGVDSVRDIIKEVGFATFDSSKRVYIIDEAHMMSQAAFNAFLKVLEEPPENTIFIFCTTEIHKIPATIASRCQKYFFPGLKTADIVAYMADVCEKEGISAPEESLTMIASAAGGAMRDALSLLELCMESDLSPEAVKKQVGIVSPEMIDSIISALRNNDAGLVASLLLEAVNFGFKDSFIRDELVRYAVEHMVGADHDEMMFLSSLLEVLMGAGDLKVQLLLHCTKQTLISELDTRVTCVEKKLAEGVTAVAVPVSPVASVTEHPAEEVISEPEASPEEEPVEMPSSDADYGFGDAEPGEFSEFDGENPFEPEEEAMEYEKEEVAAGPVVSDDEENMFDGFSSLFPF